MGNCLVMEEKVIKIMRNDGKVVEYKGPMKVHHILNQFSSHGHYSLFDSLSNNCHLHPQAKLLCGRLYYLQPKEKKTTTIQLKKKVRFANLEVQKEEEVDRLKKDCGDNTKKSVGVLRVKMVVSKQELQKMLQGGSVHEMVYRSLSKQHLSHDDDDDDDDDNDNNGIDDCHRGWRPFLESIPESD